MLGELMSVGGGTQAIAVSGCVLIIGSGNIMSRTLLSHEIVISGVKSGCVAKQYFQTIHGPCDWF